MIRETDVTLKGLGACKSVSMGGKDVLFDRISFEVSTDTNALLESSIVKEIEKEMKMSFKDMLNVIKIVNNWRGALPVEISSSNVHIGEYEEVTIHTWWINKDSFAKEEPSRTAVRKLRNAIHLITCDESIEVGESEFYGFIKVVHGFGVRLHDKVEAILESVDEESFYEILNIEREVVPVVVAGSCKYRYDGFPLRRRVDEIISKQPMLAEYIDEGGLPMYSRYDVEYNIGEIDLPEDILILDDNSCVIEKQELKIDKENGFIAVVYLNKEERGLYRC